MKNINLLKFPSIIYNIKKREYHSSFIISKYNNKIIKNNYLL